MSKLSSSLIKHKIKILSGKKDLFHSLAAKEFFFVFQAKQNKTKHIYCIMVSISELMKYGPFEWWTCLVYFL